VTGWICGTTAVCFFVSSLIQALLALNLENYTPLGWQGTLLLWAVLLVCVIMNTVLSRALPAIEIAILILHVLGFFGIIIPLINLGPVGSVHDTFTTFQNLGGWSTQALSFFIGLNGNAVAFVGTDGPIHVSGILRNCKDGTKRR
jgi:choline transport protein